MIRIYTVTICTGQHSYIDIDIVAVSMDEVMQTVAQQYGNDVMVTAIMVASE